MDRRRVQDAVTRLRERGEQPSVRKVHRLVGGSFRDISKLLREVLEAANGVQAPQATPGDLTEHGNTATPRWMRPGKPLCICQHCQQVIPGARRGQLYCCNSCAAGKATHSAGCPLAQRPW